MGSGARGQGDVGNAVRPVSPPVKKGAARACGAVRLAAGLGLTGVPERLAAWRDLGFDAVRPPVAGEWVDLPSGVRVVVREVYRYDDLRPYADGDVFSACMRSHLGVNWKKLLAVVIVNSDSLGDYYAWELAYPYLISAPPDWWS